MSRETRRDGLRSIMENRGLGALLLRRPTNFAWYTGGADNRVDHDDPLGVAAILLTNEGEYVLTDNIEAPRMRGEQTPDMDIAEHPWHTGPGALLKELAGGPVGTDHPSELGPDVTAEILPSRHVLDEEASNSTGASVRTRRRRSRRRHPRSRPTPTSWTRRRSSRLPAGVAACSPRSCWPRRRAGSGATGTRYPAAARSAGRPCSWSAPNAAASTPT
ncbi:MAG: aminopeptidase P family N-terminal domain-containing protein [Rubrobacter sp.]|nr:aminopeptidase P family N-terminal domain-containing protein [Rubrobacter sp.]